MQKTPQKPSQLTATMGRLNILPVKSVWNADGDGTTAGTSPGTSPATQAPVVNKQMCRTCRNKRIVAVAAGIAIGAVVTILLTKKGGSSAA